MPYPLFRRLWSVLLRSQVIFLVVPFILPAGSASDLTTVRTLSLVFAGVSVVVAVGTLVYRRRALVAPIQAGQLDPNTTAGVAKAFSPFIVNLVLTESIAICGLVLALLSHQVGWALPFAAGAFALMYVHRPGSPEFLPPPAAGVYRPPSL